jgi:hypothetical protein
MKNHGLVFASDEAWNIDPEYAKVCRIICHPILCDFLRSSG